MTDAYSECVRDHFEHPRHVGSLEHPDAVGYFENPASGASMVIHLAICKNVIHQAVFQSQGCAATIACGSVSTVLLTDKTLDEAYRLSRDDVEGALGGLPSTRKHAADLAIGAVRSALADFKKSGLQNCKS
ncbi:MAG: iron-sulfur cluster assembly scaffold protein [Candidatus Latescibacteria bacterium]|jgi:nitrogen fixation protein NifU and related proteins|nr:iron-sulfur cluster assembly scaffold protein [Candidatus Latescibacterota bacterium]MBT4139498.1 iron-sulfur cluster assembly scaffold protein [Candidatus Latescibacterota bacterium]MBT5830479.1 iron-sulfur cluster assembly scaffold protein [Candidatus Latescibacterota bacterium]